MQNIKVIICSGGTGGHLFPAQATVESLLNFNNYKTFKHINKINVSFFTDKRSTPYLKDLKNKLNIKIICSRQFSGKNVLYKLKSLFYIGLGFLQTLCLFIINRPKVVVSFGGYISVPVIFAALILRIPIILHEQNAILGKANRLFVRFAKAVATSFNNTIGLENYSYKVHYVGLPIRENLLKYLQKHSSNKDSFLHYNSRDNQNSATEKPNEYKEKFTISILGGSQGAKIFSSFIPKAFQKLPIDIQQELIVYHQCRKELLNSALEDWGNTKVKVIIKPFFYDIEKVLIESNLIIARSGASTIAEINCFGKAAIYIPFKKAILNHQMYNAIAMVDKKCAQMINEESLNFQNFNDIIINLLKEKSKINNMAVYAKKECRLNAAFLFSSLIINVIK